MALVHSAVIEDYIQRVTELSQSTQRIPTTTELEAIAGELGIEPAEIEAAQKHAQDHFTRAQGYLRLGYWDDAIAELEEAIAFNPGRSELLLFSAMAHLGKWQKHHQKFDADQLHLRVKQCLSLKPDCEDALNLLADFRKGKQRYSRLLITGVLFLGAIFSGATGYLLFHGGLPFVIEEKARIENLEEMIQQQNGEIARLMGEQEAVRRQFQAEMDQQLRENRINGDRLNQLQSQLKALEEKVENYQTPPKLSPSPSDPSSPDPLPPNP